jgi:hypothetical protein
MLSLYSRWYSSVKLRGPVSGGLVGKLPSPQPHPNFRSGAPAG